MEQNERREYLIRYLLNEEEGFKKIMIPDNAEEQKQLLRSLMNIRMPNEIGEDFLKVQDEYLSEAIKEKGITDYKELKPVEEGIYLWQGDITTLKCDAIVNAANSGMTGCYVPCHSCIDNCIHTYAGIRLRNHCARIMAMQGHEEETGKAKITPAYDLPCSYVIHTVGPIIYDRVRQEDEKLLKSCYRSCLNIAVENGLKSIAFCCISTGEFHFPNLLAAKIAIETVQAFKKEADHKIDVIFNVFKDSDLDIYEKLLSSYERG
ncbi:MAG: protein-ADP-ribose hydrolase [Erysipelotrichaceae bacterium]|nr:protein-ADP-ribose hydrolase [Erysipelotrichaceae bacterium]